MPAAPAAGPPVRLCSAFIGSAGHRVQRLRAVSAKPGQAPWAIRPSRHTLPPTSRLDTLSVPNGERPESRESPKPRPSCIPHPRGWDTS